MENNIRQVVSTFVKLPFAQVDETTRIDRKAVGSSIHLHRMYASLSKLGITVGDYKNVSTLGDLLAKAGLNNSGTNSTIRDGQATDSNKADRLMDFGSTNSSIGIDIERSAEFPASDDYRKDSFYVQNFTASEISYAILQINPRLTFTGLFAAKESLVKCRGDLRSLPFNEIEIKHDSNGKPNFEGTSVSISHIDDLAVAVTISGTFDDKQPETKTSEVSLASVNQSNNLISWVALITGLLALFFAIYKN